MYELWCFSEKSALAQFCVDLTTRAAQGLIDPVIGRDSEVQRIVQILCRRTKNNPILLGEPGVGKTAIAEGLALSIAKGDIPIFLAVRITFPALSINENHQHKFLLYLSQPSSVQGKRIMSLDVGLVMAGAKERGELEARVTSLISEVKQAGC